ncbi:DUF6907 domain-containing protein [Streptomyces youssoufiensis]
MTSIPQPTDSGRAKAALPCPDGIRFCLGDPWDHADPREHVHRGPTRSLDLTDGSPVLTTQVEQFDDDAPGLVIGDGTKPTLGPGAVLALADAAERLAVGLRADARLLADLTTGREAVDEPVPYTLTDAALNPVNDL